MNEPLLTIGAFARAVGLTPSALRHYDECGLLPPAEVDTATGYRYYAPDLARRAQLLVRMREAGVPIETMRTVLDGSPDEAQHVLEAFGTEQLAKAERVGELVRDVVNTLRAEPVDVPTTAVVDGPTLATALRQAKLAADTDPNSPLACVLVDLAEGVVDVVATNRYWMIVRAVRAAHAQGEGRAAIGVADAARLADRLELAHEVHLSFANGTVTVLGDDYGRGSEEYPAHRILLDGIEHAKVRAVVDRHELSQALDEAGHAEIDVSVTATGCAIGDRTIPGHANGDLTLRMGTALLLRAVKSGVGDRVILDASASDQPVVVRSPHQPEFLALVMPIKREQ